MLLVDGTYYVFIPELEVYVPLDQDAIMTTNKEEAYHGTRN